MAQSRPAPRPASFRRARRVLLPAALLALVAALVLVFRTTLTVPPTAALAAGDGLLRAQRVLVLAAHPDDLEWYVGGTLARLAREGARVEVIVASNGEKGPNRTNTPDLPATRRAEQLAAARDLGYSRTHLLGLPDRGVAADPSLLPRVRAIYDALRPQAVLIFDPALPSLPYLHPDHQGSARVFLGFWETLRDRPPLYLFQTRRPDAAVDVTEVLDLKARALARHESQNGGSGSGMKSFFRASGRAVGVGAAELFRVLR